MPLYEYKCDCGEALEAIRGIDQRYDVVCKCGKVPHLKVSAWGRVVFAGSFIVYGHDGTILDRRQTTEYTPPPAYRWDNPNLVEA